VIAALYIDEHGPYPKLAGVDAWGVSRDARLYDGAAPVVAHPPCGPWGAFAHLCKSPEQDPALAIRAVDQVRKHGGVLEHPRRSRLWRHAGLPLPGEPADAFGGITIEVDQVEWGHAAHKRTWLYLVRVPDDAIEAPPFVGRAPTHDLMGGRGRNANTNRGGKMEASKEKRRRTPVLFAEYLVRLARAARQP
jgi:hypothetical protein